MRVSVDPTWAKILKVVAIIMTVMLIVSFFIVFPLAKSLISKELANEDFDSTEVDMVYSYTYGILVLIMIGAMILQVFTLVAALKCSRDGSWRAGAITFGVIMTVSEVLSIAKMFQSPMQLVTGLISLVLSILYLVAAVNCKPIIHHDESTGSPYTSNDSPYTGSSNSNDSTDDYYRY